jgi:hypothetical protein
VRSTIGKLSSPIVLVVPSKKWKGHLPLCMMSDMFSPDDMLNLFGEGERVEEEKNFYYLKFGEGICDNIVCAMCYNQGMHRLKLIHYVLNLRS